MMTTRNVATAVLVLLSAGWANAADSTWFAARQAHVRAEPAGEVRWTVGVNTRIVRDRVDGAWWHIRVPVNGWVHGEAFSPTLDFAAGGVGGRYAQRQVHLRVSPSAAADVRATFGLNSVIRFDGVIWQGDGARWAHVTHPLSGWMQTAALGRTIVWQASHVGGRYATASLNVRAGPGTNHPVRAQIARDARVEVDAWVSQNGGWAHLKSPRSGWVFDDYLTTQAPFVVSVSGSDLALFERIVQAEAGGEPYAGRVAVAAVVINRVQSPSFPDTVRGVITQPYQFSAYHPLGTVWNFTATADTKRAVQEALRGADPSLGALYYYAYRLISPPSWTYSRTVTAVIGGHRFYR